jgi:hypothetical protein
MAIAASMRMNAEGKKFCFWSFEWPDGSSEEVSEGEEFLYQLSELIMH